MIGFLPWLPHVGRSPAAEHRIVDHRAPGGLLLVRDRRGFHLTFGRDITLKDMAARGIPIPAAVNVLAMVLSGGLALALLFNVKPRWAALGLALYTLSVSVVMYGHFQADWETTRGGRNGFVAK